MSDAPERIWACMDGPTVGLFVSGGYNAGWPEYVRADLYAKLEADLASANARADVAFASGIEAAAQTVEAYSEYDGQLCCNGHMCGCQGETVHGAILHCIHALTPPNITAAAARVLLDKSGAANARLCEIADEIYGAGASINRAIGEALRAIAEEKL